MFLVDSGSHLAKYCKAMMNYNSAGIVHSGSCRYSTLWKLPMWRIKQLDQRHQIISRPRKVTSLVKKISCLKKSFS